MGEGVSIKSICYIVFSNVLYRSDLLIPSPPLPPWSVRTAVDKQRDNLHNVLSSDLGKKNKIFHDSWNEHLKISKAAEFGCEI